MSIGNFFDSTTHPVNLVKSFIHASVKKTGDTSSTCQQTVIIKALIPPNEGQCGVLFLIYQPTTE